MTNRRQLLLRRQVLKPFFTALLRDEITTTPLPVNFSNDRSVHGSISSRMSESESRGQEQKRRRRTTSQPPANISMKKETKKAYSIFSTI
mmetsp:Transcript_14505/g.17558  ORF Transcript_14505/g.17558 Transcript_14505/m.17558 type:complete len:90 (+) Transcript_14505:255-524(+)